MPGRAAKTVEVYRDALRPILAVAGRVSLRDLTVQDVRTALAKMAVTHSTLTLQKAHNCLTRALRHAEGRGLVRRNVPALAGTPHSREGRPSQALTWDHVDLDAKTISVWRSVRFHGDTKTKRSRRTLRIPQVAVEALEAQLRRQAGERPRAGELWQEHGLVFTTSVGLPQGHRGGRAGRPLGAEGSCGPRS